MASAASSIGVDAEEPTLPRLLFLQVGLDGDKLVIANLICFLQDIGHRGVILLSLPDGGQCIRFSHLRNLVLVLGVQHLPGICLELPLPRCRGIVCSSPALLASLLYVLVFVPQCVKKLGVARITPRLPI